MDVNRHATSRFGSMGNFAKFLRDVVEKNKDQFRVFGPDETQSNKLGEIYEVCGRVTTTFEPSYGRLGSKLKISTGRRKSMAR